MKIRQIELSEIANAWVKVFPDNKHEHDALTWLVALCLQERREDQRSKSPCLQLWPSPRGRSVHCFKPWLLNPNGRYSETSNPAGRHHSLSLNGNLLAKETKGIIHLNVKNIGIWGVGQGSPALTSCLCGTSIVTFHWTGKRLEGFAAILRVSVRFVTALHWWKGGSLFWTPSFEYLLFTKNILLSVCLGRTLSGWHKGFTD